MRNSSRLHTLIESLLDVTRIESDKLRLNKERFDIYKLVNDTINDSTNKFENREKYFQSKDIVMIMMTTKMELYLFMLTEIGYKR